MVLFTLLAVRLLFVQLGAARPLSKLASDQYKTFECLLPRRGIIYDRNLKELAGSVNLNSVFLDPLIVEDKDSAAGRLSEVLDIDKDKIAGMFCEDKRFVWLARKVEPETERAIRRLHIKGIGFVKEPKRVYPNKELASHITGFVGLDDSGLEGIELKYDKFLKGSPGWIYTIRDAKRREVPGYEYREIPPADGNDIVLTIDSVIQAFAERELDAAFKKYNAKGGSIVVMDPHTGDILALANRPTYDLNDISGYSIDARRNRAICDFFEPGSSFKMVTASAVLEEAAVKPEDEFFCENGEFKWEGHTYHDHKPYGWLPFKDVIKYSSNIGTMKSALKIGDKRLYRYIKRFGFGKKTGIDLPGEVGGIVRPPSKWSKLSLCSISMGQELTVNVVQLACAISSLANGGYYIRPRVIDRIQDKAGNALERFESKRQHRVVSEETALEVRKILRGVVDGGTGKSAEVEGYFPAGKTGTAQKVEENGTYSRSKFMASFIGFLPFDEPRFVIAIVMDEPRPQHYGGTVCAPVFKKVADQLMRYYKLPPRSYKN
ncbi:MAG: penicillin-binding protein 2 [Candidatus Omnitrophica bacterium]|nr:penicillin-binding protein 2 [Candidatus Omnitrophota bacterium]MBU4590308.1 penicillin-binding protein 2 [Candidatus Omnitrophota bacterium]